MIKLVQFQPLMTGVLTQTRSKKARCSEAPPFMAKRLGLRLGWQSSAVTRPNEFVH
jgi:hypothetical protein